MDKIICLGKNYLEHAQEMGEAVPEKPVVFIKPFSILKQAYGWQNTLELSMPQGRGELHHECEIVLQIGRDAFEVSKDNALNLIENFTLGLDMTLRDEQIKQKKMGHPWCTSKVFCDSAVIGPWLPFGMWPELAPQSFDLKINEVVKQKAQVQQMRLTLAEIVSMVSYYFPLKKNDLIYTGTPAGVGPVKSGDVATLSWGNYYFKTRWT